MLAVATFVAPGAARADCTPANDLVGTKSRVDWVEGGLVYDTTNDVLKTCDGTNWTTVGGGGGLSGGTAGYLGVWTGATSLGKSSTTGGQQLFWDTTNHRLGIGTTGPAARLQVHDSGSGETSFAVNSTTPADREMAFTTNNSFRWIIGANSTAEGGSNAGSDLFINAYNDAGSFLNTGLFIKRSSGNVGIGTTSPGGHGSGAPGPYIDAYGASGGPEMYFGQPSTTDQATMAAFGGYNATRDARIGLIGFQNDGSNASAANGFISFYTNNAGALNEKMRISKAGNVGIGTTNPGATLHVKNTGADTVAIIDTPNALDGGLKLAEAGTTKWYVRLTGANDNLYIVNGSEAGVTMAQGATSWSAASDKRLKENVRPIAVLNRLGSYRAVSFDWRGTGRHDVGVIAQEMYESFPEIVHKGSEDGRIDGPSDPGAWTVTYDKLGALALQAAKELKADNDNLRAANEKHDAEIRELREEIKSLKAAR